MTHCSGRRTSPAWRGAAAVIEVWNRDIRAAKKIIAAKRNALRSGALQPELRDMIKGKAKP